MRREQPRLPGGADVKPVLGIVDPCCAVEDKSVRGFQPEGSRPAQPRANQGRVGSGASVNGSSQYSKRRLCHFQGEDLQRFRNTVVRSAAGSAAVRIRPAPGVHVDISTVYAWVRRRRQSSSIRGVIRRLDVLWVRPRGLLAGPGGVRIFCGDRCAPESSTCAITCCPTGSFFRPPLWLACCCGGGCGPRCFRSRAPGGAGGWARRWGCRPCGSWGGERSCGASILCSGLSPPGMGFGDVKLAGSWGCILVPWLGERFCRHIRGVPAGWAVVPCPARGAARHLEMSIPLDLLCWPVRAAGMLLPA